MKEYKLWLVEFDYSFQGSSSNDEQYVVTIGDSLQDIKNVLSENSSHDVEILEILKANYMGLVCLPIIDKN